VFLDARTLLYLATDPDGAGPWIFAVDVARPQPRRISTGAERYTSLAASGDGRRLVATRTSPSSTFWRVPLVDGRADLSAGRKIALTTRTGSHPRLGPGYLLYVATTGSGDGLWKLEGEKATELWSAPEARIIGAPGIRGDGRRIAFAVRQRGRALLYAVSPDGTDARVVTSALDLRGAPAWAPDGRSLTVAAVASGAPRLFRVPLDGAAPEQIGGEEGLEPVWSPAGDLLLYSGPDVGTAFPLKAARPDGSPAGLAPLTLSRGARHVAFGPGPRALVVLRGDLRHRDLWRIELDTGAERRVTDVGPGFDLADFDVGPDGRELVLEQLQERSDIVLIERAPP
jgi:dipeptidyl aminopeptidase/acylaminoacyl peptidase